MDNLRSAAQKAWADLVRDARLPSGSAHDLFALVRALKGVPASHAQQAALVEHYLATAGFTAFHVAVVRDSIPALSSPRRGWHAGKPSRQETDRRQFTPSPVSELPGFAKVALAFSSPISRPKALPPGISALVDKVTRWAETSAATWRTFESKSVHQKAAGIGVVIADAIRLQQQIRTKPIDDWLATEPAEVRQAFDDFRQAFFDRCDALGCLSADGLIASNLLMPEHGLVKMAVHNPRRIAELLGATNHLFGGIAVVAGLSRVVVRERQFFAGLVGRQLHMKGLSLSTLVRAWRVNKLNAMAGLPLVTERHSAELRTAYDALKRRGVSGERADRLVLLALRCGYDGSGKSWKGLTRLADLVFYSDVDPTAADFDATFRTAMQAAVDYTHVPGREWIVRDYELGKKLMQIDGKIAPGESAAGLQQGRGSLAVGYLRAGATRTEFGRRYSKPLGAFLDSMVAAEGPDHQRQRKAFLPFFSQRAVLEHARFVEETTARLLDGAEAVAKSNRGAFDFRKDFAYHFPIQVICRVLELPPEDVHRVQRWSEDSVRAMDTDAGVTPEIARRGQRSSDEFRAYLQGKLDDARAGQFNGTVIKAIATDATLVESERIANLGVIIFAGFETTTGLLSKGLHALLQHRGQWSFLRDSLVQGPEVEVHGQRIPDRELRWLAWAQSQPERNVDRRRLADLLALVAESPALAARFEAVQGQEQRLDAAVEEMLRWTAPGTVVPLTASKDVEVALPSKMVIKGETFEAGEMLTIRRGETIGVAVDELNRRCPFGGGRFDPGVKGGFDVSRTDNVSHLSFGLRHACIGAFLAKENAKRALEGVLRRFPNLVLDGTPVPQEMELFSGLASLPVRTAPEVR